MSKKSVLKKLANSMIDNESKKKIKKAYNEIKKECNTILNDVGIKNQKEEAKKDANHTTKKNNIKENNKITQLRENISIISCFVFLICMCVLSFAILNFVEGNVAIGILEIWLIPFIIFITILLCLKYANLKFYDFIKFLNKKIEKMINNEVFLLTVYIIFLILFIIFMVVVI